MMNKKKKRTLIDYVIGGLILVFILLLVTVISYVIYLFSNYERIEDHQTIEVEHSVDTVLSLDQEYSFLTYNIGMGIYSRDFGFFMDGGKSSRAKSKEEVEKNTNGVISVIQENHPDFVFLQEVAVNCTCSYYVNTKEMLLSSFSFMDSTFANNWNSPYLFYPITQPFGSTECGLLLLSNYQVTSSLRRSFPVETGVTKIIDLDRCYSINRISVDNGKELVLFLFHLSAYAEDPTIASRQIQMMCEDMKKEYNAGNYVIAGGDWNKDIEGDSHLLFSSANLDAGWAKNIDLSLIPEGFSIPSSLQNGTAIPSCRNADGPYDPETQYQVIIDGFLVSDNVQVISNQVINTDFEYSDHNPVLMIVKLLGE